MDADFVREFAEFEIGVTPQTAEALGELPLVRGAHPTVLDQRSTFRKGQRTTGLDLPEGALSSMGDARHKTAIKGEKRKVTPLVLKQIEAALATNRVYNMQRKLKKGAPDYRPQSPQDLADLTGADPNTVKNLLGGVRPGTKAKRPKESRLIDPICDLLGIDRTVSVEVPVTLSALVQRIAALSPEDRARVRAEVEKIETK